MDYKKLMITWRHRREKARAMIAKGLPRKEVAKMLKISKQRLSQIEHEKKT